MRAVVILPRAAKVLRRMPTNTARTIRGKIDQYASEPESLANNVSKLQGRPGYRLRVGNWRVIFNEDRVVLEIVDIGARGGIYG